MLIRNAYVDLLGKFCLQFSLFKIISYISFQKLVENFMQQSVSMVLFIRKKYFCADSCCNVYFTFVKYIWAEVPDNHLSNRSFE